MTTKTRTGGMTTVAVLNFIFGGWGVLGGLWAVLTGHAWMSRSLVLGAESQMAMVLIGRGLLGFATGVVGVVAGVGVLMLVSWGRTMNLVYAAVSIFAAVVMLFMPSPGAGGDAVIQLMVLLVQFIYPVTLIYLFRKPTWREAFSATPQP